MKARLPITTALSMLGLLFSAPAIGGEIYKFVDAQGNVHYGDRPSGDPEEERLEVVSRATDPAAVQAAVDRRREQDEVRNQKQILRENQKQEAREERAAAEKREAECTAQRERLERYARSQRLYRRDENGERVYLDGAEREAAESALRQHIETTCS